MRVSNGPGIGRGWDFAPTLAVAMLALLLVAGLTWDVEELNRASASVSHSDQVLAETHRLETLVIELEAGLRNYVITGEPAFLEPYQRSRSQAFPALDLVAQLTRDNPLQQQRLSLLRARLETWLEQSQRVLALGRIDNGASQLAALRQGDVLVDGMRQLLGRIFATERDLRDERTRIVRHRAAVTRVVALSSLLLLLAFLALAILQRRRWHLELERSNRRFHALTDQLTEYAVYLIEPDGRVASWNEGGRRLKGYQQKEVLGRHFSLFFTPEDRESSRPQRELEEAAARGQCAIQAWRMRKDGTRFWADGVITALHDTEGRLIGFAKVTRDLTEQRRRAEQQRLLGELVHELSKELEFDAVFRRVAELVVPAVADWALVDLQGERGELRRLTVVPGDPRRQEAARRFEERYPRVPPDAEGVLRVIRTGQPVLVTENPLERLRQADPDPESLELLEELGTTSYLIVPLSARGRTFGALSLLSCERKLTSDDLRLAMEIAERASLLGDNARLLQRATEEAHLREELMAIVSHDLRNPLYAIRLNAQVLTKLVGQLDPDIPKRDRIELMVSSIERGVEQGSRLISDLLESSKIESGTFSVTPGACVLDEVVEDALQTFRPIAAEKGISLEADLVPAVVSCDHERIVEVLCNLLANSVKFTRTGGEISIRAVVDSGELRVGVRDTGSGIPAEALPHVFDRFWQAKATRRAGAGLGLSIARGIVQAHGGRIWAESQPGVGSTFWFTLPLDGSTALEEATPAMHSSG